jgi:hypothetical protein
LSLNRLFRLAMAGIPGINDGIHFLSSPNISKSVCFSRL